MTVHNPTNHKRQCSATVIWIRPKPFSPPTRSNSDTANMHLRIRQLRKRIATLRGLIGVAEVETVAIAREMLKLDAHQAGELAGDWAALLAHVANMTLASTRLVDAQRRLGNRRVI
jgi:hypothetical protein